MGRPTKVQEAELFSSYVEAVTEAITEIVGSSEKALNLIAEEGIWLALGYNTFIVLGQVNKTSKPIEYAQRVTLIHTLRAFTGGAKQLQELKDLSVHIPDFKDPFNLPPIEFQPFEGLVDWFLPPFIGESGGLLTPTQPLQIVYGLIQPVVEAAAIKLDDDTFMALPFHYRVIVSLLVPGIVRSLVNILSQRSNLTLG